MGKRGRKVLLVLVARSTCFSPIPAVPALGVPPAEGGVAEPKSGGDEPASHPSGSPRNHRRIHLRYPSSAPPYPALVACGLTPLPRVPAEGAAGSALVQGSATLGFSLPATALLRQGPRDSSFLLHLDG